MKRLLHTGIVLIGLTLAGGVQAQPCDPVTPVFVANLTGSPDSNWVSPSIRRDGYCCTASGSDVCIEFILTLDSGAHGIAFNIASGAVPPGALYYQVNCGVPVPVGQQICLNGVGPHLLTFCKPGNNQNSFSITSIPDAHLDIGAPSLSSPACSGLISIQGLDESTINVSSIPPNPTYNSFLNCPSGCDTVMVRPSGAFPSFIDYQVCGMPWGGCATGQLCDTVRVFLSTDVAVNITPPGALLCNGTTTTTLVANPSGGTGRYSFLWSNGQTTQSIVAGAGTQTVTVTDSGLCAGASDAVTITVLPPMVANAGADRTVCANVASITLSGSIQAATGGLWHGNGSFTPSATTLNANYTPTAAERTSGLAILILETTGNQGCPAGYDTVRITLAPLPVPVISGPASPCISGTASYSVTSPAGVTNFWNVSGGTITGGQNTSNVNITWGNGNSGTVTVTQTITATGCSASQSYPVTFAPLPVPVINGNATSCQNSLAQYSVNATPGSSYQWQVTGGTPAGVSNATSFNVNWTAPSAGTVTVQETNSNGCVGSASFPVSLQPPVVALAGSDITVCADAPSVNLNGSVQVATGGLWHGNGSFSPSPTSLNASYTPTAAERTAGVAILVLETTGNQACSPDFDTLRITLSPLPVPVISGPAAPCVNSGATYTVNSSPGTGSFWNATGGTISGAQNTPSLNVNWGSSGSASVTVTQTTTQGCSASQTFPVTLSPLPVPVINGNPTACQNSMAQYTVNAQAGSTYAWQAAGGSIAGNSNSTSLNVSWTASGSGSVIVEETSMAGCVGTATFPVAMLPPVIANAGSDMSVCADQPVVQLNGTVLGASGGMWSGGTGSFDPENTVMNARYTPSALDITSGFVLLVLQTTGNQGCPAAYDTVRITFNPLPNPAITGTVVLCANSVTNYSVPQLTGNTYYWASNGGVINGSNSSSTANVTWSTAAGGNITLTQTNSFGCSASHTLNVTMMALPAPVVTGNSVTCQYSSELYSAPVTTGSTYAWTVNGGTVNGTTNGPSVGVTWNTSGTGNVLLTETNSFGCSQTYSVPVTIRDAPAPVLSGSNVACMGSTYSYSTVAEPNTNYTWAVSGGTVTGYSGNNGVNVLWSANGMHALSLSAINTLTGCDSTVVLDVNVASISPPVVQAASLSGCPPLTISFSGNNPTPGQTYAWSFGDIFFSASSNPTHTYSIPGIFNLVLVTQNNTGCVDTATAMVTVYPTPDASFTQNHESVDYYVKEDTLNIVNTSVGATHYLWTFGTADTSNVFEPPYNYTQPGDYTIKLFAYSAQGCVDSAESPIQVRVREHIWVPNAFSPNDDKINDYFSVRTENIAELEINIYNRWGRIFFSSNDVDFKWDGTFHGNQVPLGVYVYQITAKGMNGTEQKLVGTLSLIR